MANFSFSGLSNYGEIAGLPNFSVPNSALNAYATASNVSWTSPLVPDVSGDLLSSTAFSGNPAAFTFITAPQSVNYSQSAQVEQVSMFGTNNPPITVGSLSAGELALSEALMEGFTLGKQVQQPLEDLYKMQEVTLDSTQGFVNVPVWDVKANDRSYGWYVIETVDYDEQMRDMTGRTTRAMVNVKFRQVPQYQVNTGRDQALSKTTGQAAPKQEVAVAQANAARNTRAR
jgi:hypothetical protein